MNNYTLIAGVNGTGKSSLRGVLEGQNVLLGHIIDANALAKENNYDNIKAGREAVSEINYCLENKYIIYTGNNLGRTQNAAYLVSGTPTGIFYYSLLCRTKFKRRKSYSHCKPCA